MIPKTNPDEFEDTFGEWWYLREFDYLPDRLCYYEGNITFDFMLDATKGDFDLFDDERKAWEASDKVREARGLKPLSEKFIDRINNF